MDSAPAKHIEKPKSKDIKSTWYVKLDFIATNLTADTLSKNRAVRQAHVSQKLKRRISLIGRLMSLYRCGDVVRSGAVKLHCRHPVAGKYYSQRDYKTARTLRESRLLTNSFVFALKVGVPEGLHIGQLVGLIASSFTSLSGTLPSLGSLLQIATLRATLC